MATPPFLPDETKPADADIVSQYPAVERTFRDVVESWMLIDHDTDGEHKQVTLPERAGDPTNATNTGFLYTKDDAGDTELFYEDDGGTVTQLVKDGAPTTFPSTTSMLFYQSAAPTGWTKDTTTLNNHALRVVSSTAWSAGSKGATPFDTVFASGKTSGSHPLTVNEMPAHTHGLGTHGADNTGQDRITVKSTTASRNPTSGNLENTGGGAGHTHTLSMDLNYINVIRATKN